MGLNDEDKRWIAEELQTGFTELERRLDARLETRFLELDRSFMDRGSTPLRIVSKNSSPVPGTTLETKIITEFHK